MRPDIRRTLFCIMRNTQCDFSLACREQRYAAAVDGEQVREGHGQHGNELLLAARLSARAMDLVDES